MPPQIEPPADQTQHRPVPVFTKLTAEELDAFGIAGELGFQEERPDEVRALDRLIMDPARFFGFTVGGRWVATFGSFARPMTVPGGASVDVSAITAVTVQAPYRRQGMASRAMSEEFRRCADRGESIAALFASEGNIYGRFGFGAAQHGVSVKARTDGLRFRPEISAALAAAGGWVLEVARDEYFAAAAPLYERLRAERPGAMPRTETFWQVRLIDPPAWRDGSTAMRYVLSYDASGTVDGHATYRAKGKDDGTVPDGVTSVGEVQGETPLAEARLWQYVTSLDLMRNLTVRRLPTDHRLRNLLADPRQLTERVTDGLFVRLLDVPAALAARRYAAPARAVIEVVDEFLPDVGGRFLLTADNADDGHPGVPATCTRTDQQPDLTIAARDLAAIYLGGVPLAALHRTGLVEEHRAGAVDRLATAFSWPVAPYCPDVF